MYDKSLVLDNLHFFRTKHSRLQNSVGSGAFC